MADGPKNSNGDDHVLPVCRNKWVDSYLYIKNCKHPDRAIRLFSYLMSEYGQKLTYLGIEGVTYDIVNEKPVVKEEVRELLNTDRKQYNNLYGQIIHIGCSKTYLCKCSGNKNMRDLQSS